MRWILLTVLALATLSVVTAAPVPQHLFPQGGSYWPTAVGTTWVYQEGNTTIEEEITAASKRNGTTRLTIQVSRMTVTGRCGLGFVHDATCECGPNLLTSPELHRPTLHLPLRNRDEWDVTNRGDSRSLGGRVKVGEVETIEVPAGKFLATRVTFDITEENGKPRAEPLKRTGWYVPGIGLVQEESGSGSTMVLKSFKLGKK